MLLTGGQVCLAGQSFEQPPTFQASRILPAELLSGPHHRVANRVANDGFMNTYTIESDFGSFDATSTAELRIRVGEVSAIARLAEVSRSEEFVRGVGKAGEDILAATASVLTDPVEAFKDTASGAHEVLQSIGRGLGGDGSSDVGDLVGYARAKRQYALAFGVDPYSTNPVLQAHLSRVAQAGFAGDFGAGTAAGLASGGAGIALSAAGHMRTLQEMVEDKSPGELREINAEKLGAMGVEPAVAERFLDNEAFSPTRQTEFTGILEAMEGVSGRGELVDVGARAQDEDEALFRVRQVQMYTSYHGAVARLRSLVPVGGEAVALTADGAVVVTAPTDYVALTPALARAVEAARADLSKLAGGRGGHLWLTGRASPTARRWLEARGWTLHLNAKKRLLPTAP